jgi:hypothetical protein
VRSDIERRHPGTIDAKYDSQISLDHGAVNRVSGFRRERADFMRAERGVERVVFESLPRAPDRCLLRIAEPVKIAPEFSTARY